MPKKPPTPAPPTAPFSPRPQQPAYLTPSQAAGRLGVSVGSVRAWVRQGRMRGAVHLGGRWRIPAETVERVRTHGLDDPDDSPQEQEQEP